MTTNAEYANGLRELADWIEEHPAIAPPQDEICCYSLNTKEEAASVLNALKPCSKDYSEDMFYIRRWFGPVQLRFAFYRKEVCVRRVVGERVVPRHEEPEHVIPARVIEEHSEPVYEWDCTKALLELPEEQDEMAA